MVESTGKPSCSVSSRPLDRSASSQDWPCENGIPCLVGCEQIWYQPQKHHQRWHKVRTCFCLWGTIDMAPSWRNTVISTSKAALLTGRERNFTERRAAGDRATVHNHAAASCLARQEADHTVATTTISLGLHAKGKGGN